ncbi:Rpn family recombination-promoting nuclease/putative transposase [Castellaniella hirudinis]|uniref:Rpn family recombination-promoting nuclease/putative transposase n=1 Tax=Castellaniella hirudinis TaxID=1144617 RepID=UPI0039C36F9E
MGKLDAAYRRLFEHKELLGDILACVMSPALFDALDWQRMQPIATAHISDRLKQRTGDCAWLVPWKKQENASAADAARPAPAHGLCILLIFEQQSQPDDTMALRIATYTCLSYQTMLRNRQTRLPLPPVLPVVFYSGSRRWAAARDLSDLAGRIPTALRAYQPQMRYLLVQERDLLKAVGRPGHNLATLLFRLRHDRNIAQWQAALHALTQAILALPESQELNRSLTAWLVLMIERNANLPEPLPPTKTLQELDMIITEKPGIWAKQWLEEGRVEGHAEGRVEGRVEGRIEGHAELLLLQMAHRFGKIPASIIERIHTAQAAQLKAWALNFADARVLDDVFKPER